MDIVESSIAEDREQVELEELLFYRSDLSSCSPAAYDSYENKHMDSARLAQD